MKFSSTFILLLLMNLTTFAQAPVLTAASFPEEGDSINSYVELTPSLTIQDKGEKLFWDFSGLDGQLTVSTVFDDVNNAASSANYPEADLFVAVGNFERFYRTETNKFVEIGSTGLDPITQSVFLSNKYTTPYILRRAPLKFRDINYFKTSILSAFAFDDLPDTLKDQISIVADSIRVAVVLERFDTVDAWGNAKLPNGDSYKVLREKNAQVRSSTVAAKLPFVGWLDVTDQIKGFLPDLDVFDPQTTISYSFLSEEAKQPLAVLTLDSAGLIADVQYQGEAAPVANKDAFYQNASIHVSPNPGYGKVQFTFLDFPFGEYNLKVFSILGNVHWQKSIQINSDETTLKKNLSYLSKGTYLFSISDKSGKTLSTKRLVILKP